MVTKAGSSACLTQRRESKDYMNMLFLFRDTITFSHTVCFVVRLHIWYKSDNLHFRTIFLQFLNSFGQKKGVWLPKPSMNQYFVDCTVVSEEWHGISNVNHSLPFWHRTSTGCITIRDCSVATYIIDSTPLNRDYLKRSCRLHQIVVECWPKFGLFEHSTGVHYKNV